MAKTRPSSIRIVGENDDGTTRNVVPVSVSADKPQRNVAIAREKRICAALAAQLEAPVRRALAGEEPAPLTVTFTRKGFSDGVAISLLVTPVAS